MVQLVESAAHAGGQPQARAPSDGPSYSGLRDLRDGIAAFRIWTMLAWNDIRQRYRRSVIGPFWITISMAIFVTVLGVIYAKIFGRDIAVHMPYVAMGFMTWHFITGTTVEACRVFNEGAGIIKQIRQPYALYPLRLVWRNVLIFGHVVFLIIPIGLFFDVAWGWTVLYALPGFLLLMLNQFWVAVVVGVLSTRFRDLQPLITTIMQVSVFATPIMWPASALGDSFWIAQVNPFYHMVELVRAPLLGGQPTLLNWVAVGAMCLVGYGFAIIALRRANQRLVYWL